MKKRTSAIQLLTAERMERDGLFVFYENCDFLTVKLSRLAPGVASLLGIVENSDSMPLDFGPFRVQHFGVIAGSKLRVLHVLDDQLNVVANVRLRTSVETRAKSMQDDVEFVGLFWTAYAEYFPDFCEWLGIDPDKSGCVTRFDYCVDVAGIASDDLLAFQTAKPKRRSSVHFRERETYRRVESNDRHVLVVYDKRLDVIDKKKHKTRTASGAYPYKKYLDAGYPISRIEFRKKARALRELTDSSVRFLFAYAKQQTADHAVKALGFDLQGLLERSSSFERLPLPKREDAVVNSFVDEKAKYYLNLFFAYGTNYALLKTEAQLFLRFEQVYGERYRNWKLRRSTDAVRSDVSQVFHDDCQIS